MIYTVSLNSSIDYAFSLPEIVDDDINRIKETRVDAGGKGLNVARMLTELNCRCVALALVGGDNGKTLKALLDREKVKYRYVAIEGNVRNVFNFISEKRVLRFNEAGPVISGKELKGFFSLLESVNFKKDDVLAVSGSLPPGAPENTYRRIIEEAGRKGLCTVLDADGKALVSGLKASPGIIKPNLWELERIAGHRIDSSGLLEGALARLSEKGISKILLTLGEKGALLFSGGCMFYASVPAVGAVSSIGCGDAFLAGFLYGLYINKKEEKCLELAAAAGTAKVKTKGTLMPSKKDVLEMAEKVDVRKAEFKELEGILKKTHRD